MKISDLDYSIENIKTKNSTYSVYCYEVANLWHAQSNNYAGYGKTKGEAKEALEKKLQEMEDLINKN